MGPVDHPSFISIARIARTRGNRGEVLADYYTDFPARFQSLKEVCLELADGSRESLTIEESWDHQGRLVLKFAGYDSISAAERLSGAWVQVPCRDAVPLPEGTFFDHDLIGCSVLTVEGRVIGTVREILRISGNAQMLVAGERGEFMIPAAGQFCREVAVHEKRIVVDLPEGLMDLNE